MVVGEIIEEREVIIIGGGPGGYNAAIRAAQLGKQVTLIEKKGLGGVCLNEGCIPSKFFAEAAKKRMEIDHFKQFGIKIDQVSFDLTVLHKELNETISALQKGIKKLLLDNGVEIVQGTAFFMTENRIGVENGHTFSVYRFQRAVIAAGCKKNRKTKVDHKRIFDFESIYSIQEIPSSLLVAGSSYLALEAASTFQQLGSDVTLIIEGTDLGLDGSIEKELKRLLKKRKIKLITNARIKEIHTAQSAVIYYTKSGEDKSIEVSHLVYGPALIPATAELGVERIGMKLDQNGFINIDQTGKTSVKDIYAIGDITCGIKNASKAIKQGKVAAEMISGIASEYDESNLPSIIHTIPPISSVGLTEEQARQTFERVKSSTFPLSGLGVSAMSSQKEGIIKLVIDADQELIVGVHMIGQGAVELSSAAVLALEMIARTEDLTFMHYPHPSINEGLLEGFEALAGKAIHLAANKQQHNKTESPSQLQQHEQYNL
ncbi:dihydrolipoyl dehydrogenase family protein [Jeotgalibacillus proteolyticus]|uniref:Dihydrolipoamide dehydrogenase n=1 Tax=Jeotgalibacillus proteolyticus TaxID=2082395 RepID=A0A2S5GHE1_9BACL|nr:FAD-dependent oxidoreductase [Jeotgalibacillus proteolyticus]PPA72273.1 dihydrolipoamide dehydrogenase [Jeotgalibacillus proteolyticus]